jgi:peptidoglycan LD-endopeptidase LytH
VFSRGTTWRNVEYDSCFGGLCLLIDIRMRRRTFSPLWIGLVGLSLGGLLAAGLRLTSEPEQETKDSRVPLLSVSGPGPVVTVSYDLSIPGFARPVLDIERKLWSDEIDLMSRRLLLPIQGLSKKKLSDSFLEPRGAKRHHAIDLGAPRGRPILAVEDGVIRRIKWHPRGGLTIYQYGPEGRYSYYYAHLQKLAKGLAEGCLVQRGDVIGYVGSTGDAAASSPHLHFEVRKLANRDAWWSGDQIDPYPLFLAGEERAPRVYVNQAAD